MNDVIKVLQQVSDTCGVTKYCARCDMYNDDTGVCVFADMPYLWDFEKLEEVLKEGAKMEVIKNECISKLDVVRILQKAYAEGRVKAKDGLASVLDDINAADVQPVIETEDLATATEQFICKNCGIRIENFDKVVLEEDNDGYVDKLFSEYRFKFCPECGAKVRC